MRLLPLPTRPLPLFLGLAALAILLALSSSAPAADDAALVPANFNTKQDAQGYSWDVTPNGTINDGSDDCFDNGMMLQINGSGGNFQNPMMTADGEEYVLTGRFNSGVTVKRQIRLDTKGALMRYLETVESTGSQPQTITLTIRSQLGNRSQSTVTNGGTAFTGGTLGKGDVGCMAVQQAGARPSALWLVTDDRNRQKPAVAVQSGQRSFLTTYTLEVKPGTPVSVLHYVAQRRNVIAGNAPQLFAEIYKSARSLDRQLPRNVRKNVSNFTIRDSAGADDAPPAAVLQPVQDLLEASNLKREGSDLLVFGEAGKISGRITGDDLQVRTAYGTARVSLTDVAALSGGAGMQRPVQVYLRTGEILTGEVKAENLLFTTEAGWKAAIKPEDVSLLAWHAGPDDVMALPGAAGLLQLDSGDRLALAVGQTGMLEAATPWGNLQTPLGQVSRIISVREPYPSQRITLTNRTQLFGILRGGGLTLNTQRFGPVRVPPHAIREYQILAAEKKAAPPEKEQTIENDNADEPASPAVKEEPLCHLTGDNTLAGVIDLPEIHVATKAGTTALDPKTLRAVKRADDAREGETLFTVSLMGGDEITGQIEERVLPIRSGSKVWRVPLVHLVSASNPPPPVPLRLPPPPPLLPGLSPAVSPDGKPVP